KGIFANRDIEYFDALVGYFRASGYFKIRPFLEDVEHIRILVGIDIDEIAAIYANRGAEIRFTKDHANKLFFNSLVKEDIQKAHYSKEVEKGIIQFVEDVKTGKVRLKAHPKQNIHAKFYVFREQVFNVHNTGEVITGSSNLTASSLERNFEFNVKLNRYEDVAYALNTFENLWEEANEIEPATIAEIPQQTYLNDQFTPQQTYFKFLLEYFGESVNYDPDSIDLQAFPTVLGEDSQIHSEDEEFENFGLFDQELQEEKNKRLELLLELRAFKSDFPEIFQLIEKMPLKARVGRKDAHRKGSTIAYLKNAYHDSFFLLRADNTHKELSFLEAAEIFKPNDENEKVFRLHQQHHEQVQKAKQLFEEQEETKIIQSKTITQQLSPTVKKTLNIINSFPKDDQHTDPYSPKEHQSKDITNQIVLSESFDW
ncbi:MAG: phospholipase D-like domain-containing protein, partial [Chitinophagales bacterium]